MVYKEIYGFKNMKLSIVTTLYKSSLYVDEFYKRITLEAKKITDDYEIIFVDDGSPDDSLQKGISLYKQDKKVKVIELSRNFGHHKAIMTGLSHAKGDFVFLIDVDLEEEPELLGNFWKELHKEKDIDVIYGVQESRKGAFFERISGGAFFDLFNFFSDTKIEKNVSVIRIMSKQYVQELMQYDETEIVFVGLCALTGFNQKIIYFKKGFRGKSSYDLKRKVAMAIDMITSFSNKPLNFVFNLGLFITSFSIVFILYLFINKFLHNTLIGGWTSVMASIWLIGGLVMISIGIIGIYISKIFLEVKDRPRSIIKKTHKVDE